MAFRVGPEAKAKAISLAYRLPGHARHQAHVDYASRPLTDALLTALAHERPFADPGLEELSEVLEWREADGLWRLTVAATLTAAERVARSEESSAVREMLEGGDVVWHSSWRSQVARHIARSLFTGPDAAENRAWVGEQRLRFADELENVSHPQVIFGGHELTEGAPREPSSAEGRAATAVWRAQRAFALEDLARWLNSDRPDKAEHVVNPPGWVLRKPADWSGHRFPTTQPLPPRARSLIERGVVLHITSGSTSVLWPFSASGQPVQGFEHVVSGARELHLEPTEIAEAMLVTTDADPEQVGEPVMGYPRFPVEAAREAGLVDNDEHDRIVGEARAETSLRIHSALETAKRSRFAAVDMESLLEAANDPVRFQTVANDLGLRFWISLAWWTWPVGSIVEALSAGALSPEQLEVLGREWARQVRLTLERDMHSAWTKAMWKAIADRGEPDSGDV